MSYLLIMSSLVLIALCVGYSDMQCFGVLGVLAMRALEGSTASSGSGGCGRSQWPGLLGLCADCSLEREKISRAVGAVAP